MTAAAITVTQAVHSTAHVPNRPLCLPQNPGWTHVVWDDIEMCDFMTASFPGLVPLFNSLSHVVEQADMFRYLVIGKVSEGGTAACYNQIQGNYHVATSI